MLESLFTVSRPGKGLVTWDPTAYLGAPDEVPGFWFHPIPSLTFLIIWGSEIDLKSIVSPPLPSPGWVQQPALSGQARLWSQELHSGNPHG